MAARACEPSAWEAEAGGTCVWGQPGTQSGTLSQRKEKREQKTGKEKGQKENKGPLSPTTQIQKASQTKQKELHTTAESFTVDIENRFRLDPLHSTLFRRASRWTQTHEPGLTGWSPSSTGPPVFSSPGELWTQPSKIVNHLKQSWVFVCFSEIY